MNTVKFKIVSCMNVVVLFVCLLFTQRALQASTSQLHQEGPVTGCASKL